MQVSRDSLVVKPQLNFLTVISVQHTNMRLVANIKSPADTCKESKSKTLTDVTL